jgi:hypothetical protein
VVAHNKVLKKADAKTNRPFGRSRPGADKASPELSRSFHEELNIASQKGRNAHRATIFAEAILNEVFVAIFVPNNDYDGVLISSKNSVWITKLNFSINPYHVFCRESQTLMFVCEDFVEQSRLITCSLWELPECPCFLNIGLPRTDKALVSRWVSNHECVA